MQKIYIYGNIASYTEKANSKWIQRELENMKNESEIEVHINSQGGDVFESIAIGNLLKQFSGKVTICIDGIGASGASIIAMAGDKIIMYRNSMLMIHNAMTFAYGNAKEFLKVSEDLNKINVAVKESYMSRFVGQESELTSLLEGETWLTSDEAKAFGFCDEILEKNEKYEPKQEEKINEEETEEEKKEKEKQAILNKYVPNYKNSSGKKPKNYDKSKIFSAFIDGINKKNNDK